MQRTLKNLALVLGVGVSVVAMSGCKTTQTHVMDDKSINKKVETALETDPVYKYPAVKVSTFRGITQLSGFVDTDEQKRRATEVARMVMGPAEIINNIVVRPGGTLTPPVREGGTTGAATSSGATGTTTTTERGTVRDDGTVRTTTP